MAGEEMPAERLFVDIELGLDDQAVPDLDVIVKGQLDDEARRGDRECVAQHEVPCMGAAAHEVDVHDITRGRQAVDPELGVDKRVKPGGDNRPVPRDSDEALPRGDGMEDRLRIDLSDGFVEPTLVEKSNRRSLKNW